MCGQGSAQRDSVLNGRQYFNGIYLKRRFLRLILTTQSWIA
jgi:hypothetical protein